MSSFRQIPIFIAMRKWPKMPTLTPVQGLHKTYTYSRRESRRGVRSRAPDPLRKCRFRRRILNVHFVRLREKSWTVGNHCDKGLGYGFDHRKNPAHSLRLIKEVTFHSVFFRSGIVFTRKLKRSFRQRCRELRPNLVFPTSFLLSTKVPRSTPALG